LPLSHPNTCLYAVGKNENNELATNSDQDIPFFAPAGFGALHGRVIKDISAGWDHSAVVDENGEAHTWGSNAEGELGLDRHGGHSLYPVPVVSIDRRNKRPVTHIHAGFQRTFTRDEQSRYMCFGSSSLFECGGGIQDESDSPQYSIFSFQHDVKEITTGWHHTVFLTTDGRVWALGQLESQEMGNWRDEVEPFAVPVNTSHAVGDERIVRVGAGQMHTLAITETGKILCWGQNSYGNCATGEVTEDAVLLPTVIKTVGTVLEGKTVRDVSGGRLNSLALSTEGKVFGWGSQFHGQLGNGNFSQGEYIFPFPVQAENMDGINVTHVSSGDTFTLMLSEEGQVYACGSNFYGQLGLGQNESLDIFYPTLVDTATYLQGRRVVQVSAGGKHSLMLTDEGKVFGMGFGLALGVGTLNNQFFPVPVLTKGILHVNSLTSVSGSGTHFLFSDSEGLAMSSGLDGSHGQLGDGSFAARQFADYVLDIGTKVQIVTVGAKHSLVLTKSGGVFCFGWNSQGQCGHEDSTDIEVHPQPREIYFPGNEDHHLKMTQITAGYANTVALSELGEVYVMGANKQFGQCGTGSGKDEFVPVLLNSTRSLEGHKIRSISSGNTFVLLLSMDGVVFCMGSNVEYGECGTGSGHHELVPARVSTEGVLGGKIIVQIAAATRHSLLLSQDGIMFAFGQCADGNCGIGINVDNALVPISIEMHGLRMKRISAAGRHNVAVAADMSIWSFGWNGYNQTGTGSSEIAVGFPTMITVLPPQSENRDGDYWIAATAYNSFILTCPIVRCFGEPALHPTVCSNHGSCIGQDQCNCVDGFTGDNCNIPLCNGVMANDTSVCSSHGECMTKDVCECQDGYQGQFCGSFFCVPSADEKICSDHGRCVAPFTCRCFENFFGKQCEQQLTCHGVSFADKENVCKGFGDCVALDTCKCNQWNHAGKYCDDVTVWIVLALVAGTLFLVLLAAFFIFLIVGVFLVILRQYRQLSRARRQKRATENLLHGFIKDQEMDTVDAENTRARLIVQKSMLEIEFSELSNLQKIAVGGSGAILFRADWNGSKVAVKVFKSGLLSGETFFKDFEHEVSLMSTLRHRNIVTFLGCSLAFPRISIVMEMCESGSIQDMIENGTMRQKSSQEILRLLLDIAEGMNYLHSRGVLHRDLKCANVLIDEHGVAKLTDFGLSKYTKDAMEMAKHTTGIGTSYYADPSQWRGDGAYAEGVDVYSFGIMAMEILLCRLRPFPDSSNMSDMQIQYQALNDASFRPDVKELEGRYSFLGWVLKTCWEEDSQKRPPFRDIVKILKSSLFDVDE